MIQSIGCVMRYGYAYDLRKPQLAFACLLGAFVCSSGSQTSLPESMGEEVSEDRVNEDMVVDPDHMKAWVFGYDYLPSTHTLVCKQ